MDFQSLVNVLWEIHRQSKQHVTKAINLSLTIRNWLIGWHITEYELQGADRSQYGDKLIPTLAKELTFRGLSNCNRRQLYRYMKFYQTYPEIVETLSPQFKKLLPEVSLPEKVGTSSPRSGLTGETLVSQLSYSHFELLVDQDDPLKRAFYEIECIQGNWSVRELKRQIVSLYYERSGLSKDKKALSDHVQSLARTTTMPATIRDPYVFEFIGLNARDVMYESDLEQALLDKLQDFMLELGHGFCFEDRQKRIRIGKEYYFVDLVFYHRILRCHVLIELKVDAFKHEYLGQLNTYLNWFEANEMTEGDNHLWDCCFVQKKIMPW